MKFAFIDTEKVQWPVLVLCAVLGVSRAGYYAWKRRGPSAHAMADERLGDEVRAAHERSRRTYGSPRVHHVLKTRGLRVGKKRIERLMRERGIVAKRRRRFRKTTDSKHQHPVAPNTLNRQFDVAQPNQAWVTDVTYVWTAEGWLYLGVMLDLCSRRVVGWAASETNDRELALDVLARASASRRPPAGLLHHSDRGSPYASEDYRKALRRQGAEASMSRRGDCWDNAVAESFFATIKGELIDHEFYSSHAVAIASIGEYIDSLPDVNYKAPIATVTLPHRPRSSPACPSSSWSS